MASAAEPVRSGVELTIACDDFSGRDLARSVDLELSPRPNLAPAIELSVSCSDRGLRLRVTRDDTSDSIEQVLERPRGPSGALVRTTALAMAELVAVFDARWSIGIDSAPGSTLPSSQSEPPVEWDNTSPLPPDQARKQPSKTHAAREQSRRKDAVTPRQPVEGQDAPPEASPATSDGDELAPDPEADTASVAQSPGEDSTWSSCLGWEFREFTNDAGLMGLTLSVGMRKLRLGFSSLNGDLGSSGNGSLTTVQAFYDFAEDTRATLRPAYGPHVGLGLARLPSLEGTHSYFEGGVGLGAQLRLGDAWRLTALAQGGIASGPRVQASNDDEDASSSLGYDSFYGGLSFSLAALL